uniref:Uncharacterized protein n=1 Tax=Globisporangium ultimum (strain ATCC 200006 / CBS 805.95 / DAOM BR144) TaxID=431595 RepID=K3WX71_GLOUD
ARRRDADDRSIGAAAVGIVDEGSDGRLQGTGARGALHAARIRGHLRARVGLRLPPAGLCVPLPGVDRRHRPQHSASAAELGDLQPQSDQMAAQRNVPEEEEGLAHKASALDATKTYSSVCNHAVEQLIKTRR